MENVEKYEVVSILGKLKEFLDDNRKEDACKYVNEVIVSLKTDKFAGERIIIKDFVAKCDGQLFPLLKMLYLDGYGDFVMNPVFVDGKVIIHVMIETSESKAAEIENRYYEMIGRVKTDED